MANTMATTATTLIAGSLIPDGDTVLKLKNNATYISHHRGITHSIPFTILWPILITFIIYVLFPGVDTTHIWLWAQLAVFYMYLLIYLILMVLKLCVHSQTSGFN